MARTKLHNETECADYTDTNRFVWYLHRSNTGVMNSGFRYRPGIQKPNGGIETNPSFDHTDVCLRTAPRLTQLTYKYNQI